MEHPSNHLNSVDRKILRTFSVIEDTICNLRDLVAARGRTKSSLCWFPKIRECEIQLSKLFVATYAAEVFYRHPEDDVTNSNELQ